MGLRHEIPSEFTDEDRWFKYFTKKTLAFIMVGCVITCLLFKLCSFFGGAIIGVVLGLVITVALGAVSMIPVPENQFLRGGGLTYDVIIIRRFIRRKNKVVYVKGYENEKERRNTKE